MIEPLSYEEFCQRLQELGFAFETDEDGVQYVKGLRLKTPHEMQSEVE